MERWQKLKVIENNESSQDEFNSEVDTCGTSKVELSQEQLNSLQNGKCIALFDGEYTTFLTLKNEQKKVERVGENRLRVTSSGKEPFTIQLEHGAWKIVDKSNSNCEKPGCLVNHEVKNMVGTPSKGYAKNGDAHVVWLIKNELGQHEIKHGVSTDGEKTWTITSKEVMDGVVKGAFS